MATREEIGKQIQQSRKDKRLTQAQLSDMTRINKTTISEIENGRFTGSFDIFERLLNALDLQFEIATKAHSLPSWEDIDDLFAEDE